jgi:hypothetical protein
LRFLNFSKVPFLTFMKKVHDFLLKSSIKTTMYLDPSRNASRNGPHRLEWINSFFLIDLIELSFGILALCYLPIMQSPQTCVVTKSLKIPTTLPNFDNVCNPWKFKCPSCWCQRLTIDLSSNIISKGMCCQLEWFCC